MLRVEHIGFAVRNLPEANILYSKLLGTEPYKHETVASEHVTTSFFKVGEVKIELLGATSDKSAIASFLDQRGEGLHHIAFEVKNIRREIERLKKEGFKIVYEEPKRGADNKLVAFIHPKTAGGTLIELCQEME